jgi:hypothetical protein
MKGVRLQNPKLPDRLDELRVAKPAAQPSVVDAPFANHE